MKLPDKSKYDKSPEEKKKSLEWTPGPGLSQWLDSHWRQQGYFTSAFRLMGGASPDETFSSPIRCPLKDLQWVLGSVSLIPQKIPCTCGALKSSPPAQQGFPLGERFLCSTFSRRITCLQILLFTFQPFCQTHGLFGICGSRNLEGSGNFFLSLQAPAHLSELRHPLAVQAHSALSLPRFLEAQQARKSRDLPATEAGFLRSCQGSLCKRF